MTPWKLEMPSWYRDGQIRPGSKIAHCEGFTFQDIIGGGDGLTVSSGSSLTSEQEITANVWDYTDGNFLEILGTLCVDKHFLRCGGHDNLPKLVDMAVDSTRLTLVYEKIPAGMSATVASRSPEDLSKDARALTKQVLEGLRFAHSAGLYHGSLRPTELLLSDDLRVTITGFNCPGLPERWRYDDPYLAPELLFKESLEGKDAWASDIWAAGMLFAHLCFGSPLIESCDPVRMLNSIVSLIGMPSEEDRTWITNSAGLRHLEKYDRTPGQMLSDRYPDLDPVTMDFLQKMLQFNPAKRPDAAAALRHPLFGDLPGKADDFVAGSGPPLFVVRPEDAFPSSQTMHKLLLEQLADFRVLQHGDHLTKSADM